MHRLLLSIALLLSVAGCGKRSSPAGGGPVPSTAATNAAADEDSNALDPGQVDRLLQELTQAVRKYSVEQQRVPKGLDEVAARGYLARVPEAPPGKRFAIHRNLQVYLEAR
ncbi:MAG: hypothetical protein U1G07_10820 [Verrucomicrobiota bacterium]